MGAGGEDGADYQVVSVLLLSFKGAIVVVHGAAYDHTVANQGASFRWTQGLFAQVNAIGTAEKGYVHPLVDDEQGVAIYSLSNVHSKVQERAARQVLLAKLDHVDAAFDGQCYLLDQGSIMT